MFILMRKSWLVAFTLAFGLMLALAGCGSKPSAASGGTSPSAGSGSGSASTSTPASANTSDNRSGAAASSAASGQSSATVSPTAAASGDKAMTLYVAEGFDKAVSKAFTAKTGIKVNIVHVPTGDLIAKIQAERNNPHWDAVWFDGAESMQSLDNQGLLLKNWEPEAASTYTDLGKSLIAKDKSYFPTHVTAAAAIAYNTKTVAKKDIPQTWTDLLKPVFKNAIGMNDPSISGPTYPFVYGMMEQMGETKGKQFFEALKKNGLKTYPKNPPTVQSLLSGTTKAIMVQDVAIIDSKNKGNPIDIVYPKSGVFMLYGTIAVSSHAQHPDAAKQFVNFVLDPSTQKTMTDYKVGGHDSYFQPIVHGVKPNPVRAAYTGMKWVTTDPVQGAAKENEIKKWFHDNISQ